MRYERYGMILLLVLVSTKILGGPLSTATSWLFDKLLVFAEFRLSACDAFRVKAYGIPMIQEPSYHLEGVVHARDELEDFTGPLDLILMLLAKDKIEIRDIQISQLLDQYLAYLQKMQEMDLEIASEFVQMASHLMYIKTKMLLTEEKEPTELEVLVSALEQLKTAMRSPLCGRSPRRSDSLPRWA